MTRTEIIAQLDAEINRLERARAFLTAALKNVKDIPTKKVKAPVAARPRKKAPTAMAPVAVAAAAPSAPKAAAAAPQLKLEPQVQRVPPRRRLERRQLQTEKVSAAALSGSVPMGPVAVSANEARKQQERSAPVAAAPAEPEVRPDLPNERSLGSLIQAFERRAGLSRLEIP